MKINESNDNEKKNNNVSSGKVCRAFDYSDQDLITITNGNTESWSE